MGEERAGPSTPPWGLQDLPSSLVGSILSTLDIRSICSVSAASRSLHSSASLALSFLPSLHLLDIAPTLDLLQPLLPPNPHLRSLKVDCRRLDDSSIADLARPSLQELCLVNCDGFGGDLLTTIGSRCRDLRSLTLGSVGPQIDINASDLEQLLSGCTELECLKLDFDLLSFDHNNFTEPWRKAPRNLKSLEIALVLSTVVTEMLSLTIESGSPPYYIKSSIFPILQKLCLSVDCITDSLVISISKNLMFLSHLDLHDAPFIEPTVTSDLTNYGLQQINPRGTLKHLSLVRSQEFLYTFFHRVNDLGILLMAQTCSNLESVCLEGFCRVTDSGFRTILHSCTNLLNLTVCYGNQLTDLVFHDISATSLSLKHVSLRSCPLLSNVAIIGLVCNTDLTILDLRHCRSLGNEALRAVSTLPKLKVLLLDFMDIGDLGISYLVHIRSPLTSLTLRGCKRLTETGISAIFGSSFRHSLQVLDLSNIPSISDNTILALAKTGVPITELRLRECPLIGDTSVMALASMKVEGGWHGSSLRLLDLYKTGGITSLAFRWFKKPYFPRLRWLGVTGSTNRDLLCALERNRPFLHVSSHGEEIGSVYSDTSDGWYRHINNMEEVDELEQWLLEGENEYDEDEDMDME
ncbi:F-box/LRR-repeat protein 10 [Acorus gramineus]|uniref:F-box/LRR-repeat protein 10 n=1 Tax=Acorus gramineus TaxID=55184 RepID=A0AAV9AAE8_ACOGR|nr:F-box/LRR-repeat protein 10 [Acorus gramineus]